MEENNNTFYINLSIKIFIIVFFYLISQNIFSQNSHLLNKYNFFINEIGLNIKWDDKNFDEYIQRNELYYNNGQNIKNSDWIKIDGFQKLYTKMKNIRIFDSNNTDSRFINSINNAVISNENKYICGSSDGGEVKIYDIINKKCVFKGNDNQYKKILSLEFIDKYKQIAFTSESRNFYIYDYYNNKLILNDEYSKHNFSPEVMTVSKDSSYIAVGTDVITIYKNYSNNSWKNIHTSLKQNRIVINNLEFYKDNFIIAGIGDSVSTDNNNFIDIVNLKNHEKKRFYHIENDVSSFISSIIVNPDNDQIFISNNDGSIIGYEIFNGYLKDKYFFNSQNDFTSPIYCFDISQNARYLAGGSRNGLVIIYDLDKNNQLLKLKKYFKYPIMNIKFVPNSDYVAIVSLDHKLLVYDYIKNEILMYIDDIENRSKSGKRSCMSVSPDGKFIARGTDNRKLEVFKVENIIYNNNTLVYIENEPYNQITAIFNKYFNGLKNHDKIFFYQVNMSNNKIPVYHIRIKLKNSKYMLVRTTTDVEEFGYLFDKMQYRGASQLSINIIIADSEKDLDEGTTENGDWNSKAGILLKLDSKEIKKIKSR